jgi:HAD superfamily hydrolase (TIGR01458 family)
MTIDGLLLDIDGVLSVSWEPIPGSIDAMDAFRRAGLPICLITNTTTHPRAELAQVLNDAGFSIAPDEVMTAVTATAAYLRAAHPGARVFVLSDGDARADMEGVALTDRPDDADVVVLGGASKDFTYPAVNAVFRRLMDGAALVAMHRNLYWRTAGGLELDAGAYVAGLEAATGREAVVCGKPSAAYFAAALDVLEYEPEQTWMVGDDVEADVGGAMDAGLAGILVRTGKYREDLVNESGIEPTATVDSIADVPELLSI